VAHKLLFVACVAVAAYQLWRVPRVWAFLVLFIPLMPRVALAAVPGNTTPIRVDDLVISAALTVWFFRAPRREAPASPASFFLALYWGVAAACTLIGMAALTTAPQTGVLHAGRFLEYGLLYLLFYTSVAPEDLPGFLEVLRTSLLLVCAIWIGQHWTHAPAEEATAWATLYPTFAASYDFGGYLMIVTVLLYALWITGASRTAWTTIAMVAAAIVTAFSESRSSVVFLAVVIAIDVVVYRRWKVALALVPVAAAAPFLLRSKKMMLLTSAIGALLTNFNADAVRQAIATDPSLALRMSNWKLAFAHWGARPFFGDGLGGYLAYARQYDKPSSIDGWYVRVLADTGVAGFVAFVLLVAALLWLLADAVERETDPLRRAIVYGAALAVAAASISAALVDIFASYKIMGVFWMIVACGTRVAAERPPATADCTAAESATADCSSDCSR
jgi:O-Antigen ligase